LIRNERLGEIGYEAWVGIEKLAIVHHSIPYGGERLDILRVVPKMNCDWVRK
jgi:hypothetical protein